ncbi:hypothetical protein ACHAPJ_009936 [Fusarium lateritium]
MAFKSNELFHYFYELEDPCDVAPKERRQDLLTSVMQSADALRNTMLIAGLHYAWNAGHLMSFEPTLLFHKIEAMNLINEFLQESGPKYGVCVRHIATLSFMECALGNITAAETHLNGLMRFMDVHRPPHLLNQADFDLDDELSNRYIILSYNFIHGFKSRLYDILEQNNLHKPHQQPSPSQVEELMHGWHKTEMHGLDIRLKALKMLPFFFTELPPATKFQDIDVTSMVDCLINLTATARLRSQSVDPHDQQVIWQEGAATRLMLGFVGLHIESISGGDNTRWSTKSRTQLTSSWSGMATAAGLYLHVILQFWNAGEPIPTQLHRRILYILKQDLDRSRHWLGAGSRVTSDLWFWKAFIGAMSLERGVAFDTQGILAPLRRPYKKFVQEWSVVVGVTMWDEAKEALGKIVWPEPFNLGHLAENLWYRSLS